MTTQIETIRVSEWKPGKSAGSPHHVEALEDGKILCMPDLRFELAEYEHRFLDPATLGDNAKSLAFDPISGSLKHHSGHEAEIAAMMARFAASSRALVCALLPIYASALQWGRASFRPVGIEGRPTSIAKDDTLLHVDAFPTSPVADRRILRVFSNVNAHGAGRHWRIGEPFTQVARRFYPAVREPLPGSAWAMRTFGLTRGYRTAYDNAMLQIHDSMKRDAEYQKSVAAADFHFPPGSTWIVFTDSVSHAALAGQHLFEQTFYVPVSAMADQSKAPLRILESLAGRPLAA